jgi:hypothetical protein
VKVMAQDGKQKASGTPFSTADGKPTQSGDLGSSPGNDFVKTTNPQSPPVPGHDFTKDVCAPPKQEVKPSPDEIPAGGAVLKLDKPAEVGTTGGVAAGGALPWKGLA